MQKIKKKNCHSNNAVTKKAVDCVHSFGFSLLGLTDKVVLTAVGHSRMWGPQSAQVSVEED